MKFVSIIMGSKSDYEIMKNCADTFEQFKQYKTEQQVLIPIIPWLIKAGANGAAGHHASQTQTSCCCRSIECGERTRGAELD